MVPNLAMKASSVTRNIFGLYGKSAFACAVTMAVLATGNVQAETLKESLSNAYLSNSTLQAGLAGQRAVDEGVNQALSLWKPTVTASGSASSQRTYSNRSGGGDSTNTVNPLTASVNVTQNIYRGGRNGAQIDKAESQVAAGLASLRNTEQSVLLEAATAYLDVLRDEAVVDLNKNNESVLRRQLEATQDRFEVGEITRTDVSQAEARLSGAIAARISAEGQLAVSRATFARVMGYVPEDLQPVEMKLSLPATLDEALQITKQDNVSIQVAQYTLNSALHDVDLVRGELRPTVTLQGAVSASHGASDSSSESNTASISANVSVPLYQSGAVYSRLRASKHTAAQRRLEVDVARKQARESSLQAWENLNSARAQIVSIKDQINAAQVALEGVQREAQVGSRTVLDVLDAEQELLDARVNLVTAERDEKVAAFTLFASLGQLSAQNLQLDVPYYTPEKHADDVRGIWLGSSESADEDEKRAAK